MSSVADTHGGTETDVKARIGKARVAFLQLKNIWKSNNKIWIFNANVRAVLFFTEQRHGGPH